PGMEERQVGMSTEELSGSRPVPRLYGDVPTFLGAPRALDPGDLAGAQAAVLGIPFDGLATFRGGATRLAPQFIRKYSLLWGSYNLSLDLDISSYGKLVDYGDVDVVPGDEAESYRRAEERLGEILAAGAVPVGIGGDHGISVPMVRAVARARQGGPPARPGKGHRLHHHGRGGGPAHRGRGPGGPGTGVSPRERPVHQRRHRRL